MAGSKRVLRFAKAERERDKAHSLVAGFPLEFALRKLANDPQAGSKTRDLAKIALTGGPDARGDAIQGALWRLHDSLLDEGHPASEWYQWMSASDKVHTDHVVHQALSRMADGRAMFNGRTYLPGESREYWHTPEAVAETASRGVGTKKATRPGSDVYLNTVTMNRVKESAKAINPQLDDKQIEESVRRHAHRARYVWANQPNQHGGTLAPSLAKDYEAESAREFPEHFLADKNTPHVLNAKAARYRRRGKSSKFARTLPDSRDLRHWFASIQAHQDPAQPSRVNHQTAGVFGDWLMDNDDWRHWIMMRTADPVLGENGAPQSWVRHDGGAEIDTRPTPAGGRPGETYHPLPGIIGNNASLSIWHGPHSSLVATSHSLPEGHPLTFGHAFAVLNPDEYEGMRQEAATAGVRLPPFLGATRPDRPRGGFVGTARYGRVRRYSSVIRDMLKTHASGQEVPGYAFHDAVLDTGHPLAEAIMDGAANHRNRPGNPEPIPEAIAASAFLQAPEFTHELLQRNGPSIHGFDSRSRNSGRDIRAHHSVDDANGSVVSLWPHAHHPLSKILVQYHPDESYGTMPGIEAAMRPRELYAMLPHIPEPHRTAVANWLSTNLPTAQTDHERHLSSHYGHQPDRLSRLRTAFRKRYAKKPGVVGRLLEKITKRWQVTDKPKGRRSADDVLAEHGVDTGSGPQYASLPRVEKQWNNMTVAPPVQGVPLNQAANVFGGNRRRRDALAASIDRGGKPLSFPRRPAGLATPAATAVSGNSSTQAKPSAPPSKLPFRIPPRPSQTTQPFAQLVQERAARNASSIAGTNPVTGGVKFGPRLHSSVSEALTASAPIQTLADGRTVHMATAKGTVNGQTKRYVTLGLRGPDGQLQHTGVFGLQELQQLADRGHGWLKPHLERVGRRGGFVGTAKYGRAGIVSRYLKPRNDFIDALRRIRSSDNKALKQAAAAVASKLGLDPVHMADALSDAAHGSVPGVVSAIYGRGKPEDVHQLAAWMGLQANSPGVGVFHVRPGGSDRLHKFEQQGSGLDIRQKLDKAGISQRVIIPKRNGWTIMVPDQGGQQYARVRDYTQQHGLPLQSSTGYFKAVGAADRVDARAKYRDRIVAGESGKNSKIPG